MVFEVWRLSPYRREKESGTISVFSRDEQCNSGLRMEFLDLN